LSVVGEKRLTAKGAKNGRKDRKGKQASEFNFGVLTCSEGLRCQATSKTFTTEGTELTEKTAENESETRALESAVRKVFPVKSRITKVRTGKSVRHEP
jgi:hypothetical protein